MQEQSVEELMARVLVKIDGLMMMIEEGDLDEAYECLSDLDDMVAKAMVKQVEENVSERALEVLAASESIEEATAKFKEWGRKVIIN